MKLITALLLRIAIAVLLVNLIGWTQILNVVHTATQVVRNQFSAASISQGDRNGLKP